MYKTASGERKFSLGRFINNAVPNLAQAPRQDDLDPAEQDALFQFQLTEPDPPKLCHLSLVMGGITKSEKLAGQIYKALVKNGVLSEDSSTVDTRAITSSFPHQVACISTFAQKKLVHLLFFWEEEQQRWRVLTEERLELKAVIDAEKETGGEVGSFEKRLGELEGLIRLKPTLRGKEARDAEGLPDYEPPKQGHARAEPSAASN